MLVIGSLTHTEVLTLSWGKEITTRLTRLDTFHRWWYGASNYPIHQMLIRETLGFRVKTTLLFSLQLSSTCSHCHHLKCSCRTSMSSGARTSWPALRECLAGSAQHWHPGPIAVEEPTCGGTWATETWPKQILRQILRQISKVDFNALHISVLWSCTYWWQLLGVPEQFFFLHPCCTFVLIVLVVGNCVVFGS